MHRIDNSTAAATMPTRKPVGPAGFFTQGDQTTGTLATIVEADILNALMMEICNVITNAGIALNKTNDSQLWQAIQQLLNAATPHGPAGGDLTGTYPNPTFNHGVAHTWSVLQSFAAGLTATGGNISATAGRLRAGYGASGGDANTAPILSDFVFGSGPSGNYFRFPGGMLIQFGVVTTASGTGDLYNFPVAFPNSCLSFVCSDNGGGMADTGGSPWSGNPLAIFQVWAGYNGVYPNPPTYRPGVGVEFIAIGY